MLAALDQLKSVTVRADGSEQSCTVIPMRFLHFRNAAVNVVRDMEKNHTMAFAAALSYYFVLSLFPFLILLSAVGI